MEKKKRSKAHIRKFASAMYPMAAEKGKGIQFIYHSWSTVVTLEPFSHDTERPRDS